MARPITSPRTAGGVIAAPVHIDGTVVEALQARLADPRWPTPAVRAPWVDGVDGELMRRLVDRWCDGFSWPDRQNGLNRYRHIHTDIDNVMFHAMIAEPSGAADPVPLLAIHGWPSTFEQMTRLADLLSSPRYGTTVVAPSLPGYGFSSAPTEPGWDTARTARALHTLMTDRLGYDRYLVRGTDYGLSVALHLGATYPRHVVGVHIGGNHLAAPDDADLPDDLTVTEQAFIDASRRWYRDEGGYAEIQATKPETQAYALSDSPIGLLAYITDKYRSWCATPDELTKTFGLDDLLSTATIYWATNTIASSMRLYREDRLGSPLPRSTAPVAVNQPSDEEYWPPESWWRRLQPVARHTVLPDASHFPEWENPTALAADLAAFRKSL